MKMNVTKRDVLNWLDYKCAQEMERSQDLFHAYMDADVDGRLDESRVWRQAVISADARACEYRDLAARLRAMDA